MKIAVFIPSLTSGGAERVAVTLANEFAMLGHTTHLLVATDVPAKYVHEINDSVSAHFFNASRTFKCVPSLARFINTNKPTVLLAIMDHAAIAAYAALLLSRERKNIRLFVRQAVSLEYKRAEFTGLKGAVKMYTKEAFVRIVYRNTDGVISPSSILAQSLRSQYAPHINVMHIDNPVVTIDFKERSLSTPVNLPWQAAHKTVISAGRFTSQKDFLCLLKAFKILRKKVDCKLVLLGEGPEQDSLEDFIIENNLRQHCYLPGFVSNPLTYFVAADVFALPSKFEGSPNVLIQALACGAAVVSSDCPTGPAEILNNEEYGTLVPVGNEKAMANAIEKTLSNLNTKKQQSIAKSIQEKYNSKKIATEYLSYLSSADKSEIDPV